MAEAEQRQKIVSGMRSLHAVSVENLVGAGTPDINYRDGWIECKWVRRWPVRPDTAVPVPHFIPEQRSWARQRWRAGGISLLMLSSGREWLLFLGPTSADYLGTSPLGLLREVATAVWRTGFNKQELLSCLECIRAQRPSISLFGNDGKTYRWNKQQSNLESIDIPPKP